MIVNSIIIFMLHSFLYVAISALEFPKDHQFNCLDSFNKDRCTLSTRKVYVYDSESNKCVKKNWYGCSTGNMFYDADNCNNACTRCIHENGDQAEYMGFKYLSDTLSPSNRTEFYQLLNKLEGHLRMLSDKDSLINQRANSEVDGNDDENDEEMTLSKTLSDDISDEALLRNNDDDDDDEKEPEKEPKVEDNPDETDDNWEDENSEWDDKE